MEEKNTIGCHAIDTNINMYDGSTKFVQYIRVGESVLGDATSLSYSAVKMFW